VSEPRFRISSDVVHETVDGEVIAIDLGDGSYYSVAGSGPAVWELLIGGGTEAEICDALASRFDAGEDAIRGEVAALLEKLVESRLVVSTEEVTGSPPVANGGKAAEKDQFEAPRFERYTDMKDYFLLDPIHEVDPAGWPKPAA
jgi:coenzyme PQQ synthesis protein D (PqqD)